MSVAINQHIAGLQNYRRAVLVVPIAVCEKQCAPKVIHNGVVFHAALQQILTETIVVAQHKIGCCIQTLRKLRNICAVAVAAK